MADYVSSFCELFIEDSCSDVYDTYSNVSFLIKNTVRLTRRTNKVGIAITSELFLRAI